MKPLWDMEDPVNLQDFVILELKNLGIKVPRSKKIKPQDPAPCDKVFGNYLCYLPCVPVENCGHVPKFLVSAVALIEKFIDTEGLFRKSGAISRQKELKQQIEQDLDFSDSQVFDVTGVLKQFFRELPDPLLTNKYHDTFIKCYQLTDRRRAEECVLDLCLLLPGEHLGTLRYMMKFLARVADNSDVNKMDAGNLAVVLGPNIMHVNTNKTEKMNACEEKLLQIQTSIVEFLIRNADKVGVVSNSLLERLELMENLQLPENHSEIKMDTLTVEDANKKNKKKKRRSSSLQGFVSNIAQSIAKWRTTPAKTNSSQLSGGSESSYENIPASMTAPLPIITPKLMRKRKASGEAVAFSATKKKAILMHMPNTPYTPASSQRRLPPEIEKALEKGTPSINFTKGENVEFTATPNKRKTPRKRLSLFSPSGARKSKSWSVTTSSSSLKPASPKEKKKSLFRRLSGGKSKADSPSSGKQPLHEHVGERLASPAHGNSRNDSDSKLSKKGGKNKSKVVNRESPISALVTVLPMIHLNSPQPVDSDDNLSDRFHSPMKLDDPKKVLTHQHISAPSGLVVGTSFYNRRDKANVKLHRRAKSAEVNHIKRGKPNTLANGLNSKEISLPLKIRREPLRRKCSRSKSLHVTSRRQLVIENSFATRTSSSRLNRSRTSFNAVDRSMIDPNIVLTPPRQFADLSRLVNKVNDSPKPMEEDVHSDSEESEAGFSTISGDTVIFVPSAKLTVAKECGDQSITQAVEKLAEAQMAKNKCIERLGPEGGTGTLKRSATMKRSSKKYSSLHNLQKPEPVQCGSVSRSQSLYDTSCKRRHGAPNLMVSSDTRNILARAGYVKEMEKVTEESVLDNSRSANNSRLSNSSRLVDKSQISNKSGIKDNSNVVDGINSDDSSRHNDKVGSAQTKEHSEEVTKSRGDKSSTAKGDEEMAPILRASVNPVYHESVLDLQKAAKVSDNLPKFNDSNDDSEIVERYTSPLRFPKSTTRTRGSSPVRIPTIFAKADNEAEKFRQIAINALKSDIRPSKRTGANLPISTQLLRPSAEATKYTELANPMCNLTRKPSIYKVRPEALNMSKRLRKDVVKSESERLLACKDSPSVLEAMTSDDDVFNVTPHPNGDFTEATQDSMSTTNDFSNLTTSETLDVKDKFALNESLQETVNEVCTPLSEKLLKNSDRISKTPLRESTNTSIPADERLLKVTPHIRQAMLDKPQGRIRLRTASGMTPRHILLPNRTPAARSPLKPVKRLGSPASPFRRSPRRATISGKKSSLISEPSLLSVPSNHHISQRFLNDQL